MKTDENLFDEVFLETNSNIRRIAAISLYLESVFRSINDTILQWQTVCSLNRCLLPLIQSSILIKLFLFSLSPQTYLAFVQDHDSATVHHRVETMGYD